MVREALAEETRPVTRVVITGAGGMVFPLRLAADLLATPALHGVPLVLHDPDVGRAERTARATRRIAEAHGLPVDLRVTGDRPAALDGATHVMITFQVGGLAAYEADMELPRRYGIDCVAGDTLNPGGIMRFLRSTPAFDALARDVRTWCPGALVMNHANPMAMNCLYLHALGMNVIGLCHSVPGSARTIAALLGMPERELAYVAAGVNHQAWFLRLATRSEDTGDLNARLARVLRERFMPEFGGVTPWTEGGDTYVGGQERVRAELMETYGYFLSESSHHASEYVPYFRRSPVSVKAHLPRRWDYLRGSRATRGHEDAQITAATSALQAELRHSGEYGMQIVAAGHTGEDTDVYANVRNAGFIENLPDDACVEVPCHVDAHGVHPRAVGRLPAACAGLNLASVAVQTTAVEAVLKRDVRALVAAFALDPLTASVLDLPGIRSLARDLFEAQRPWLPAWVTA